MNLSSISNCDLIEYTDSTKFDTSKRPSALDPFCRD